MAKDDTKTAAQAPKSRTVFELADPIEFNGETIASISYRRATGRDMRKALNTGKTGDRYMGLAVDLFEMPEGFFDKMSGPDFMAMTDILDGFFKPSQQA